MTDFDKYAVSMGISSNTINEYNKFLLKNSYINPTVIEERPNMNMINIDIFSRLLMDRILFLGNEINSDVVNIFNAQLLWLEQQSGLDINLYINSPGGEVQNGLALIDTMNFIKPDIATTCVGTAASMAAVILSNGTKGKRYMMPHSRFMIHQVSGGMERSQYSDMQIAIDHMKELQGEIYGILHENSNLTLEEITQMADRDCWLKAEDTIKYGFADHIIDRKNEH